MKKLQKVIGDFARNRYAQVLVGLIVLGGILRYYGIENAENTDEYNEVFEALRVASGKLNLNRWHKKGYQHILAVVFGGYFTVGYITGLFTGVMDFAAKIVRDMDPLFILGRIMTASLGTASIAVMYLVGSKIYNRKVGLLAAALLSVSTIHVWTSHLVNTDVPMTFFFLLSLLFIARFQEDGGAKNYFWAAFLGAVAINIKTTAVGIGLIFLLAHVIRSRREGEPWYRLLICREIRWSVLGFVLGLVVSNPAIVVGLKKIVLYHYAVYTNVYEEVPYATEGSGYWAYLKIVYHEFGMILFGFACAALLFSLVKRENWDKILLPFVLGVFLALGGTDFLVQDRYLMSVFVVLFLLVARFVVSASERVAVSAKWRNALLVVCLCALTAGPLLGSLQFVQTLSEENTSKASKRWIETNIPPGSKILMDAGHTIITSGPRISQTREQLEEKLAAIKNLKDGQTYDSPMVRVVDSYAAIYFELLLKNMPDITYEITTTELGRDVESVSYYKDKGYQYFVHDKGLAYRIHDKNWRSKYPKSAQFYDSFRRSYFLVKDFPPSATRSGPPIQIYRID